METRMNKYHSDGTNARSEKNQKLYAEVTDEDKNYLELGTVGTNNEIDISKVKEMLKSREDYQRAKQYRELLGERFKPIDKEIKEEKFEDKVYDINSVLSDAKKSRDSAHDEYRKITNTEYDILGKLDIKDLEKQAQELLEKNRREEEDLKDLINTISSQTLARKTKEALALDLLADLKTTAITTATPVKEEEPLEKTDNSFFTTSAVFDKRDFEDFNDIKETKKVDKVLINVLIGLVIVIIIILAIFIFLNFK